MIMGMVAPSVWPLRTLLVGPAGEWLWGRKPRTRRVNPVILLCINKLHLLYISLEKTFLKLYEKLFLKENSFDKYIFDFMQKIGPIVQPWKRRVNQILLQCINKIYLSCPIGIHYIFSPCINLYAIEIGHTLSKVWTKIKIDFHVS